MYFEKPAFRGNKDETVQCYIEQLILFREGHIENKFMTNTVYILEHNNHDQVCTLVFSVYCDFSGVIWQITGNSTLQANNTFTSKLCIYEGNPSVTGGFPARRALVAECVSMSWRHHIDRGYNDRAQWIYVTDRILHLQYMSKSTWSIDVSFINTIWQYLMEILQKWQRYRSGHRSFINGSLTMPRGINIISGTVCRMCSEPFLNHCWLVVDLNRENKRQWKFSQNKNV